MARAMTRLLPSGAKASSMSLRLPSKKKIASISASSSPACGSRAANSSGGADAETVSGWLAGAVPCGLSEQALEQNYEAGSASIHNAGFAQRW